MRIFYSSEKCRIADHLIFNFNDLTEFIKFYNHYNDKKIQEIEEMPIKVQNALKNKIWNKLTVRKFILIYNLFNNYHYFYYN